MTTSVTDDSETIANGARPKRGPKRKPPWQGDLGQFEGFSPREAVTDAIIGLIRSGELKPGMRLPSEPQLVEMTGISRSSVREAVRGLQTMGLLEIRRGQGTFVREIESSSAVDAQMLLLLDNRQVLLDLMEVRQALEPLIARLAAEHANEDDVEAMRAALAQMTESQFGEHWRPAHLAFHSALVNATRNTLLMKIWSLVTIFLKDSPLVTASRPENDEQVHKGILEAVSANDPAAAVEAMSIHIRDMLTVTKIPD
jgi:GntR family transcriptional repressor for pyruvate dehydrogenase complex